MILINILPSIYLEFYFWIKQSKKKKFLNCISNGASIMHLNIFYTHLTTNGVSYMFDLVDKGRKKSIKQQINNSLRLISFLVFPLVNFHFYGVKASLCHNIITYKQKYKIKIIPIFILFWFVTLTLSDIQEISVQPYTNEEQR